MSFTDAAEYVLKHFANKRPLHYRDITQRALEHGLVRTSGRTPEATLYAQVLSENARRARRGEAPRFVKQGRGYVGLTEWQGIGLATQIEQHNADVRKKLHARLQAMSPDDFEALIGQLLAAIGFENVEVTTKSGDGGIDVRGTLVVGDVIRTRMAVQVKRWRHNVQAPIVQQVRGALGAHEQGLIITTSDFGKGARAEAQRPDATPVGVMNGEQLVALLVEYDIGIHRTTHDLIELGAIEPE
jgi:restriction system protein